MHYLFMLIYTRTRVPVAATVAATVALSTGPLPEAMQRPCWSQARLKHWVGECSMTFGSQWALLGVTPVKKLASSYVAAQLLMCFV